MFILVKRNCLSAHGEIFRRGEVVEVDDEAGKALLASEDYVEVMPPEGAAEEAAEEAAKEPEKTPVKASARGKGKSTKGKSAEGKKAESEDALPAPDVEGTVEG
ncbi:MAG: hypothetical protein PUH15_03295 [Dialister sp.]|nr:hypothetical protein [Dialister sp.]MDD7197197.1 hypothetical protein [Dialister sp.]MDY5545554.1 hypothetical protein [Dialister sp.]